MLLFSVPGSEWCSSHSCSAFPIFVVLCIRSNEVLLLGTPAIEVLRVRNLTVSLSMSDLMSCSTILFFCMSDLMSCSTIMLFCMSDLTCCSTILFFCVSDLMCCSTILFFCMSDLMCCSTILLFCVSDLMCRSTILFFHVSDLMCCSTILFFCVSQTYVLFYNFVLLCVRPDGVVLQYRSSVCQT
jgi:hypothetical protein